MSCERTFDPLINARIDARTFTGRTESQIGCDVRAHNDLKHWVIVKNLLNYIIEIAVSAEIADPRMVRFVHCPEHNLPDSSGVQDHSWDSQTTLDNGKGETFAVFLLSDLPHGKPQEIGIKVKAVRFHPPRYRKESEVTITVMA